VRIPEVARHGASTFCLLSAKKRVNADHLEGKNRKVAPFRRLIDVRYYSSHACVK